MATKLVTRLAGVFVFWSILLLPGAAQQSAPSSSSSAPTQSAPAGMQTSTPPQPVDTQTKKDAKTTSESAGQGTSNDRLFFTLPNFLTLENAGRVPPLTAKQKFAVTVRGSFDYSQYPWHAFLSGISQAQDSEPGYGQGWAGYGKRYAASFADGTIENFMTGAILPSLLHQDPRYFQSGHGSFMHRAFYAMSRNLITRGDSGKNQFNYSEVVGGAMAAAISTFSYHPTSKVVTTTTPGVYRYIPSDRTLENAAKVWGTQYAYDTMTIVIKEFWPDIRRKLRKTKSEPGITVEKP
ncbi:MAG TPA: hypothetical protein VMS18_26460 [Candidatus Binatia bacterium]|nr:hypothetical protein [Candidatus Binatia bacterium]